MENKKQKSWDIDFLVNFTLPTFSLDLDNFTRS